MQLAARIQSVIELLEAFNASEAPADAIIGRYFRERKFIGSKDKKYVSELFYQILRRYFEIGQTNPRLMVLAALGLFEDKSPDDISAFFSGEKYAPAILDEDERDFLKNFSPTSNKLNYPLWLEARLRESFGDGFEAELTAINQQAPLDLRVNTIKCHSGEGGNPEKLDTGFRRYDEFRNDIVKLLADEGIRAVPTPHSPIGLRVPQRTPIFATKVFKDGLIEVQDEGSQLVSLLARAKAGQTVVDLCSGAGGKTLALAAKMKNKGRIYAFDVAARRLEECEKRLRRAGVHNVTVKQIESESDKHLKRLHGMADVVVVDAPCSGSGTWRRSPDLKIRLTEEKLQKLIALQQSILLSARKLVKPNGRLVYITCSVLKDENERQIEKFIAANPEYSVRVQRVLTPYRSNTDGFYAVVLSTSAHEEGSGEAEE